MQIKICKMEETRNDQASIDLTTIIHFSVTLISLTARCKANAGPDIKNKIWRYREKERGGEAK